MLVENATIADALQWAKQVLTEHNISDDGHTSSAAIDSKVLLAACLDCEQTYLHTWPEAVLTDPLRQQYEAYVQQRLQGKPVAYIIGYRDFWTLSLKVSPDTLIPRSDTESLVETALALPLKENARVLDLGTGTGAIALALASEQPNWHIIGLDKNEGAVTLAKQNAVRNKLEHVAFLPSDWFSAIQLQTFDLIVTNPPYVETHSEYLNRGDVRFEPASALTSGQDGLDDIRHIVYAAKRYLATKAWLVIEHGFAQGEAVSHILKSNGYCDISTKNDINGLPRLTIARFM